MVAISVYKGNLHRVPDVPRRWPRPAAKISLKDFRILLRRRSRALSRLRSAASVGATDTNPNDVSVSNPDDSILDSNQISDALNDNHVSYCNQPCSHCPEPQLLSRDELKEGTEPKGDEVVVDGGKKVECGDSLNVLKEKTDSLIEKKNGDIAKNEEKTEVPVDTEVERCNTDDATSEKEKRVKEIKEKLEILNEKKHNLVQALKQILGAEEQLKRQNSMQGTSGRPPLPLQVDTTTDTGSMTRVNTPRVGANGVPCGDMDGGEADDLSNRNNQSRQLPRMSSTSPSFDSQQRKAASNTVPFTHRTSLGVTNSPSPSRFAPAGQVHSSVSVSGTSYVASSPSPAASGGTSIFRDGRLPSPWN